MAAFTTDASTMTQAVQALYATIDPALPKLYLDEYPETVQQLGGAFYQHEGEVPSYATGGKKPNLIVGRFTISFFNVDSTAAETQAQAMMAAFNVYIQTTLSLPNGQNLTLRRTNYTVQATKLRDQNNNPVYMISASYTVNIRNPVA